jgi:hypothetical protein
MSSNATASEREDRVFTAAFGIMDSSQEGEAVAAFLRVRELLRRRGGGFRRLLERCKEAEHRNEELGRQNAALLRENAALRARDSRPTPAPSTDDSNPPSTSAAAGIQPRGFRNWGFWHWSFRHRDLGLVVIIAVWAVFGLIAVATAFALAAAVLICAAFIHRLSPVRFFAGALLALAAYAAAAPAPARPSRPTASAYEVADAQRPPPAAAAPVATAPAATPPPAVAAQPQTFADLPHQLRVAADPWRRPPAEPRARHGAKVDCGSYQLQPGFRCARGHQWRRDSFFDFEPSLGMRSD